MSPAIGHVGEQKGAAISLVEPPLELPACERMKLGILIDRPVDAPELLSADKVRPVRPTAIVHEITTIPISEIAPSQAVAARACDHLDLPAAGPGEALIEIAPSGFSPPGPRNVGFVP
jgi:hypothetical protein